MCNQLEAALGDNIFSGTSVGSTTADELNCFCGMVDRWGALSVFPAGITVRDSQHRKSLTGFEPAQNLSLGFVEWSFAIVIATNRSSCSWSDPVDYIIASIIGAGVRDEEITISFAKMNHRKIKAQETGTTFPLSTENLSAVMRAKFT